MTFHGVQKMPAQNFYCEAAWHAEDVPRGPIHDGRYEIAIEARSWPDARKRPLRVTNAPVTVTFASGETHPLPGHVCSECVRVLAEGLRPTQTPGQENLWG